MNDRATPCYYCGSPHFLIRKCFDRVRLFCRECGSWFDGVKTRDGLEGTWQPGRGWLLPTVCLD